MTRTDLLEQKRFSTHASLSWIGPLLLCTEEVHRLPSGIPGVYLLHVFAPRLGGYPVVYAGSSLDLRRRLDEHLSSRKAKAAVQAVRLLERAYFSAAPVEFPHLLRNVEAGLILALQPICNTTVPAAIPVLVNLPPLSLSH